MPEARNRNIARHTPEGIGPMPEEKWNSSRQPAPPEIKKTADLKPMHNKTG